MRQVNVLMPIAVKELRETVGMAAIAAIVAFCFVTVGMVGVFPWSTSFDYVLPFVTESSHLSTVAFGLAIGLGLKQSAWESYTGTYLFLLHRPIERRLIMAVKIAVGLFVYGITMSIPLLVLALWAATPGTHASPFFWSMTVPAWQGLLTGALLYLGSFLSGLGQGRWYGSRLLPLASMGGATVLLLHFNTSWPLVSLIALGAISGLLWLAIVLTSTEREYA